MVCPQVLFCLLLPIFMPGLFKANHIPLLCPPLQAMSCGYKDYPGQLPGKEKVAKASTWKKQCLIVKQSQSHGII